MASQALLDRARSGDEAAFAELVAPYRQELHVHCHRMLGSFDDADDAVQETLLAAWRGLATFQGKASLRTWLYRIATNTCLNLIRTASRSSQMTEPLPATAPPPIERGDLAAALPRYVARRPASRRPRPRSADRAARSSVSGICHRAAVAVPAGPCRSRPPRRARLHRP
jgi:RNA polymerase sigma factor (sigma-70 family)